MPPIFARSTILVLVTLSLASSANLVAQLSTTNPDLTAHEWGTFTSIAGRDGKAVDWLPQAGSVDLPGFVEHLGSAEFKLALRGTVRMETPVLYFYAPSETTLSVKVAFSKGLITEWYPRASRVEPSKVSDNASLYRRKSSGSITWDSVTVAPGLPGSGLLGSGLPARFPHEDRENHYYAARETAAAPLVVRTSAGQQQEKFLFYRGVSTFSVPVSATVSRAGKLLVRNSRQEAIPNVMLFERRGDRLGYRLGGPLQNELSLDPPELTSTLEAMSRDLEDILISQGLYPDEAHAMLETWRQSWFEEGSRLIYIVPRSFVDTILPLTIKPAPTQIVRVFVGRLELVTPTTEKAVTDALAAHDRKAIEKYGRFLQPILDEMREESPARAQQIDKDLQLTYSVPQN
jgi:hypothetical protein